MSLLKKSILPVCSLIMVLSLLSVTGSAQILNIDKLDTSSYSPKLQPSMNFSVGMEVDKQQHTLWDATNTAEIMLQKMKELLILSGSYRFTYNGPDDILNAGFVHLRFRHNYKNKIQPESFLQYQWDNKRGLLHRSLAGMNLRYNLQKNSNWEVNAAVGLMYEAERWNYTAVDSSKLPANTMPVTNHLLKLNSYIRFNWKTSENSDLALSIFLQTRPTVFHPRIAPGLIWNISAGKHVGFSINFSGIYDQSPVVPINRFYYSLSNSILVKI